MPFTHIRVRSHYSLLRSALSVKDVVAQAKAAGCKHAVLADLNAMYGVPEFFDEAVKAGVKPVVALEIERFGRPLLLVAKNNAGYANLMAVSTSVMTGVEPKLGKPLEGVAVVLPPAPPGAPAFKVPAGMEWYDGEDPDAANAIAAPLIDCRSERESKDLMKALASIRGDGPDGAAGDGRLNGRSWFYSEAEAKKEFNATQLKNVGKLLDGVELSLSAFRADPPKFDVPERGKNATAFDYLRVLCREGLKDRFGGSVVGKEYVDRLLHELNVIREMGFCDYFLVVREFVKFAKDEGILVGPGRGSAVGSLVSYALKITEVDPIKYGLIFERFLNPQRASPPDIDTDIMDTRRDEVIEHLFKKYPENHVAHIVTFQRVKVKSALRDAGRVKGFSPDRVDELCRLVDPFHDEDMDEAKRHSPRFRQKAEELPDVVDLAAKLVGLPRQVGTHAAGIVVSGSDISKAVPLMSGLNKRPTVQFSMEHLERFGLIKMDLLGLRNLSTIHEVMQLARAGGKKVPRLEDIPLDDKETYELFSAADTNGIFQFESPGMKRTLARVRPRELEDLSLTSSLFRPGPQENIPAFVARRNGQQEDEYVSPKLVPVLKPTHGIIVYQEQVIDTARAVAGFDAARADLFRRAVSKKDSAQLASARGEFVAGAVKNGLPEKDARLVFEWIARFASYGFNHSHAVAYSLIGYWMGWLKTHFFPEFMCVLLTASANDRAKVAAYAQEAARRGVPVLPPHINLSQRGFASVDGALYFGIGAIKGVGPEAVEAILACRAAQPGGQFADALQALAQFVVPGAPWRVRKSVVSALVDAGALDGMGYDPKVVRQYRDYFVKLGVVNQVRPEPEDAAVRATRKELAEYAEKRRALLGVDFAEGGGR